MPTDSTNGRGGSAEPDPISTRFDEEALRRGLGPLVDLPQFVLWKREWDGKTKRWTKVPYRAAKPSSKASTKAPTTWATFAEAVSAARGLDGYGIGVVLTEHDEVVGVDLDHCIGESGEPEPWALEIAARVNSYCETSPSGSGLRILALGHKPEGAGCKRGRVECYEEGRFFTLTGAPPPSPLKPGKVREASDKIVWLCQKHLRREDSRKVGVAGRRAVRLNDDEVIAKVRGARNRQKFECLWSGDAAGYPSQSEADLALIRVLAFWTQDADQLDRLFRRSGLMRAKWDEDRGGQTYGALTIAKVIQGGGDTYQAANADAIERGAGMASTAGVESGDPVAVLVEAIKRTYVRDQSRDQIRADQPVSVVSELLTRGTTTGISAAGGTGKTTLAMQLAIEIALGKPVWKYAGFQPEGNRVLYVAGEDVRPSLNYLLDAMMEHYGLQRLPSRLAILPTRELPSRGLVLDKVSAAALARLVTEEGFDVVILDTAVSLLPGDVSVINPAQVRDWQRSTVGQIEDAGAAVLMLVHDNKEGKAFSGTADWTNHMRLALHLKESTNSEGVARLNLIRIKSNFGFPHKTLAIERRGLINTVVVTESASGVAEIDGGRALYDYVEVTLLGRPESERTGKNEVGRSLFETFRAKGVTRQCVRDFLDDRCVWEERRQGRTRPLVLVGLREEQR